MLIYPIAVAALAILSNVAERFERSRSNPQKLPRDLGLWGVAVIVLLAGIAALRWQVGTDYETYYRSFPRYVEEFRNGILPWEEPGIRAIAWTVDYLGGSAIGMLSIAAFITIGLCIRTIWRWSPALTFSCTIFVLSGAWHGSFNGVRQYLAAAIILAGHQCIINRQFLRWTLIVLLASTFHISALIALLFYFVPRKLTSTLGQVSLIAIALGSFYLGSEILQLIDQVHRLGEVSDSPNALHGVNPLRVAFAFVPIVIYWILPSPQVSEENRSGFYVNMVVVFAACMLAFSSSALLARFIIYPQLFLGIGLAYMTNFKSKNDKITVRTLLIILSAIFMYFEVSINPDLNQFKWIFDRHVV